MPLSPKSTGFSDDGLSYEVAGDYNKLLGQALASYEARVNNPQSYQETDQQYQQRVGSASGILGNELAPLGIGNGLSSTLLKQQRGNATDTIRNVAPGSSVGRYNPVTGQYEQLFTNPAKTPEFSKRQTLLLSDNHDEIARTQKLLDAITGNRQDDLDKRNAYGNRLVTLGHQRKALMGGQDDGQVRPQVPPQAQGGLPPSVEQGPAPTPYAFMGIPGGTNLIQGTLGQQPAPVEIVKPGQVGTASKPGIAEPGSRGLLPKELVPRYLGWAHGDRKLAEQMAIENGYLIEH